MLANLKGNVGRLLNLRIHLVIVNRTLVVRPLSWRVYLLLAVATMLLTFLWLPRDSVPPVRAFSSFWFAGGARHDEINTAALTPLGLCEGTLTDIRDGASYLADFPNGLEGGSTLSRQGSCGIWKLVVSSSQKDGSGHPSVAL